MKHTIEWHRECLKNSLASAQRKKEVIDRMTDELSIDNARNRFLQYQIDEAIRLGKDGFDDEKFMRKVPQFNNKQ